MFVGVIFIIEKNQKLYGCHFQFLLGFLSYVFHRLKQENCEYLSAIVGLNIGVIGI